MDHLFPTSIELFPTSIETLRLEAAQGSGLLDFGRRLSPATASVMR